MSDFFERLIQRTNGRMPVIRPLVRPVYGTFPPVIESFSEFEESIAFNEGTGSSPVTSKAQAIMPTESSENKKNPAPTIRPKETARTETREKAIIPEIHRKPSLHSKEVEHTPEPGKVTTREGDVFSETKTEKVFEEGYPLARTAAGVSSDRESVVKSQPDSLRTVTAARRRNETTVNTESNTAELVIHEEAVNQRTENVIIPESVSEQRPEMPKIRQNTPSSTTGMAPESEAEEKGPAGERTLVRDYVPEAKPGGIYNGALSGSIPEPVSTRQESSHSNTIKVTIGRVELKATRQAERPPLRTPPVPKRPVVTLDAYLEARGKESR